MECDVLYITKPEPQQTALAEVFTALASSNEATAMPSKLQSGGVSMLGSLARSSHLRTASLASKRGSCCAALT